MSQGERVALSSRQTHTLTLGEAVTRHQEAQGARVGVASPQRTTDGAEKKGDPTSSVLLQFQEYPLPGAFLTGASPIWSQTFQGKCGKQS